MSSERLVRICGADGLNPLKRRKRVREKPAKKTATGGEQPSAQLAPVLTRTRRVLVGRTHLISFGVLADKGLVVGGERGGVVVDVQHSDVDGHPADLLRVVWQRRRAWSGPRAASQRGGVDLLNSVAMTEMLCQACSSRSSSRRTYTEPLPAWMLNTLSMSVRQSMVYL